MENFKNIRWKQRFQNLKKAFVLLEKTVDIKSMSEIERGGPIPFFVDVMCFDTLDNTVLKMHIKQFGITIYSNTTN